MSTNAAFKLQDAGFTRQQVEALSEFTDTQAASKTDLLRETMAIRSELAETKAELKTDITASEHRLELKIADVKASLETKIEAAKADTLKGIIGLILGGVVINALTIVGSMLTLFKALGR
jgi:stress response protein YsnF